MNAGGNGADVSALFPERRQQFWTFSGKQDFMFLHESNIWDRRISTEQYSLDSFRNQLTSG